MLLESRPNIVVDDNYRMFVKEMQRRYSERGAMVYTNKEIIEQERKDAHARSMAPDAYRISAGIETGMSAYKNEKNYMTTEDYLRYFGECHDTFDAVNYYAMHKEPSKPEEDKILVNRRMVEKIRRENRLSADRAMRPRNETFADKVEGFLSAVFAYRRRALTGMAAAALSLVLMVGGVFVFSGNKTDKEMVKNDNEAKVMDAVQDIGSEKTAQG